MICIYTDLAGNIAHHLHFSTKQDFLTISNDAILIASGINIDLDDEKAKDRSIENINIFKTIRKAVLNYYKWKGRIK